MRARSAQLRLAGWLIAVGLSTLSLSVTEAEAQGRSGTGRSSTTAQPTEAQTVAAAQCSDADPNVRIEGCGRIIDGQAVVGRQRLVAALLNRAGAYRQVGSFKPALADIRRVLAIEPKRAAAWAERGALNLLLDDVASAVADFGRALELAPGNTEALIGRAAAHDRAGELGLAVADLDRAVKAGATLGRAWSNRAHIKLRLGRYEEALADAEEGVARAPGDAWSFEVRGLVHRLNGNVAAARSDFERMIALAGDAPRGFVLRAGVLAEARELSAAIADYSKALSSKPDLAEALAGRAWCHFLGGDHERAIADASAAVAKDDGLAAAYDTRGHARAALGQTSEALADFEAAIARAPSLAAARLGRGRIRAARGDVAGALADLEMAAASPAAGPDDRQVVDAAAKLLPGLRAKREQAAPVQPDAGAPGRRVGPDLPQRLEPPVWDMMRSATECRLVARWSDRVLMLFARGGLEGTRGAFRIGLGVEHTGWRLGGGMSPKVVLSAEGAGLKPIDLAGRAAVVSSTLTGAVALSLGPLGLADLEKGLLKSQALVVAVDGANVEFPLGDLWVWLPILEGCLAELSGAPARRR